MSSSPLFIKVAESMVMRRPIDQFSHHPPPHDHLLPGQLGPAGEATSSIASSSQLMKGFVNSTYELYIGYEGQALQLAHRKGGIVFRRGNYDDDPQSSSHQAKYGFFRWTPFLSFKDGAEQHQVASTWIDELIISKERIATPGASVSGPIPRPPILEPN